ncbi:MAG: imidazoleglycerol-phosphate dehydratase HisB [Clostridium sp.]|uniref:imidazoleglycerol-phosphate dehydratase HisB n=2 Tax=Clostridium sp. TaxID=1506 RepID=UPI002FC695AD
MKVRIAERSRKTSETDITLKLNIDGQGIRNIDTGIGFLDHMLDLMAKHGFMDLDVKCIGDTHIDYHHTVEDIAIVLGEAFLEAIGDKASITRYSTIFTPMDEALSMVSLDISGRSYLHFDVTYTRDKVGDFDVELAEEFFRAFAMNAKVTLHMNLNYGVNNHHIIEGLFKGLGRALNSACEKKDSIKGVLSTKGVL